MCLHEETVYVPACEDAYIADNAWTHGELPSRGCYVVCCRRDVIDQHVDGHPEYTLTPVYPGFNYVVTVLLRHEYLPFGGDVLTPVYGKPTQWMTRDGALRHVVDVAAKWHRATVRTNSDTGVHIETTEGLGGTAEVVVNRLNADINTRFPRELHTLDVVVSNIIIIAVAGGRTKRAGGH